LLCVNALAATFLAFSLDAGLSSTLAAILAIFPPVPFFINTPPKISAILTEDEGFYGGKEGSLMLV
jgi:hypothetical protein